MGLQESCVGPRAQPVTIAVQEHQDHTTGPAKPSWREVRSVGQDLWGRPASPFMGYMGPHLEALALHSPRGTREHQSGPSLGPTSMEKTGPERGGHGQLQGRQSPEVPWRLWPTHLNLILPSTTWLSTLDDIILGTRGRAIRSGHTPAPQRQASREARNGSPLGRSCSGPQL